MTRLNIRPRTLCSTFSVFTTSNYLYEKGQRLSIIQSAVNDLPRYILAFLLSLCQCPDKIMEKGQRTKLVESTVASPFQH